MDMNAHVTASEAAKILNRFNPDRNWSWFLALNRFGKTSDCSVVPYQYGDSIILYRMKDIVELLKTYVVKLMPEHDVCAAIENLGSKSDIELSELLTELAGDDFVDADVVDSDVLHKSDGDSSVCMDEEILLGFFEAMNNIRIKHEVCAENLTVLSGAVEAFIGTVSKEPLPDSKEIAVFCRRLISESYRSAAEVDDLSNMLYQIASGAVNPNALLADKGGVSTGDVASEIECDKKACDISEGGKS